MNIGQDSLKTKTQLQVNDKSYIYFSLQKAEENHFKGISRYYALKMEKLLLLMI
jgi:aconitate hydratase